MRHAFPPRTMCSRERALNSVNRAQYFDPRVLYSTKQYSPKKTLFPLQNIYIYIYVYVYTVSYREDFTYMYSIFIECEYFMKERGVRLEYM